MPSKREIYFTLKSQKSTKAPDPDGLHLGFFQTFWNIIKISFCNCIFYVFSVNKVCKWLNKMLICLIPKGNRNETINGHRPISLCNTILKVISKILTTRLRPFLEKLVYHYQ